MHLIVCIEERDGMSFCGRRLSSDRLVSSHIIKMISGEKLWLSPYSAGLFPEQEVFTAEDFLEKAEAGEYCFVENTPVPTELPGLESVILYNWNRRYPSTMRFPREILDGKELICVEEFSGHSHDKITMERYQ